jgi:ATP-binding cassette, subfamily B, bacterial
MRDTGKVSGESSSGLGAGARLIRVYASRHPKPFVVAVGGAAVFGIMTVGWSWAIGRVVEHVVRPLFAGSSPGFLWPFLLLIGIGITRTASALLRRANASTLRHRNAATWHELVVDQLLAQPVSFFRRQNTGDLLAAADSDADAAVNVLSPLPFSLGVLVLLVTSIVWMLSVDPVLGLVASILLPLLMVANRIFEGKVAGPMVRIQAGVAVLAGGTHEMVDGFGAVKALGLEQEMTRQLDGQIATVTTAKVDAMKIRLGFETAQDLFIPVMNVLAMLLGAARVRSGALTVGSVVSLLVLVNLMTWPLRLLGWALADLPRSVAAANRLNRVLDEPVPLISTVEATRNVANVIELRGITMVHDDGRVALNGVNLDVRRGETLAIVGPTGSGKSTLLEVLCGLEVPTDGTRRVSAEVGPTDLAMVFQEPIVLNGSLLSNLSLGRADDAESLRSSAQIESALRISESDEFVSMLSDGLDTHVGERGVSLSGGQRQRLALARALARRPAVLLLDDTTSSLDAETEERVLRRISAQNAAETLVIVAARPSAINFASRVIVLDNGVIVGDGSHEELLLSSPLYADLVAALQGSRPSGVSHG